MDVTVEKLDDINFIISGIVANSVLQDKANTFKDKLDKENKTEEKINEEAQQEAAGEVFKEFIDAGVKEAGINVADLLGQPGLQKYDQQDENIFLQVALSTSPHIDINIEYKDVIPHFTKPVADAKAVEEKLAEFVLQQSPFTKIDTPRAVLNDDVTVIDFTGFLDGKVFEGGSAEKFNLKIGSGSFIPGFEEQIIGMEYGETRDVIVSFPDDYESKELAGKEAKFIVKLHEIQEKKAIIPDDKFAQGILSDSNATLDTLRAKMADQITSEEVSQIYMRDLKPKILEGLLGKFEFTLPKNIIEQEIDAKVREKTKSYTEEEHKVLVEDKEKFLALRESVRKEAQNSIKTALIVEALAKKEGIEIQDHEVQAALTYQAMMAGQDAQELVKYYEDNNLMTSAKIGLTEDKLFGVMLGFNQ